MESIALYPVLVPLALRRNISPTKRADSAKRDFIVSHLISLKAKAVSFFAPAPAKTKPKVTEVSQQYSHLITMVALSIVLSLVEIMKNAVRPVAIIDPTESSTFII